MPRDEKFKLFTATQTLDVQYDFFGTNREAVSVVIPATDIHAVLYEGYNGLWDTRARLKYKNEKLIYKKDCQHEINLATAAITFLHTDTDTEEGSFGDDISQTTFHLSVSGNPDWIHVPLDFYDRSTEFMAPGAKARRDYAYTGSLCLRILAFEEISDHYDYVASQWVTSQSEFRASVNGSMFHEAFHHSEQAIMHYLSSAVGIKDLVRRARNDAHAAYLYGIVLDLYSDRPVCGNCNISLLGMQNSHKFGFLKNLSYALEKGRVQPRTGAPLMLSTRVSASDRYRGIPIRELCNLAGDKGKRHHYNPDSVVQIFQAVNRSLGTISASRRKGHTFSSYTGDFFAQSNFKYKYLQKEIGRTRSDANAAASASIPKGV